MLAPGVLLSACTNDKPDEGGTSLPRATTTSTTSAAERYAVPDAITPEYVNDVLAALNHVYGDVVRKKAIERSLQPTDLIPLRAVFNDPEFEVQAELISKTPPKPLGEYTDPIGERRVTVIKLLTANPDCIAVEATFDYSSLLRHPPAPAVGWITLRHTQTEADPQNLNPTPWSIARDSITEENGCDS